MLFEIPFLMIEVWADSLIENQMLVQQTLANQPTPRLHLLPAPYLTRHFPIPSPPRKLNFYHPRWLFPGHPLTDANELFPLLKHLPNSPPLPLPSDIEGEHIGVTPNRML